MASEYFHGSTTIHWFKTHFNCKIIQRNCLPSKVSQNEKNKNILCRVSKVIRKQPSPKERNYVQQYNSRLTLQSISN